MDKVSSRAGRGSNRLGVYSQRRLHGSQSSHVSGKKTLTREDATVSEGSAGVMAKHVDVEIAQVGRE